VLFSRHEVEQAPQGDADDPDRDMADATYRVLERLKEDERIALALRGIDGMQVSEVAEACGVSRSTIKRVLARAQARFRLLARSEPALREWVQQLGERA
jgi:RNA polymerase sigma-70 factor (ECF subfamily)